MRLDESTAYSFSPVFKEMPFVRGEMDCFNDTEMKATNPSKKDGLPAAEMERRAAMSDQERRQMRNEQAMVQVAILPGCEAYRRGGWEDTQASSGKEKGIRIRRLTDAYVFCRWGLERRWKNGEAADQPARHGSRWGGGFVEFFPGVEGVVDPEHEEGKEKGRTGEEEGNE
ncbi:hypothetical protein B5807_02184 [Epicoccum nigrum]|uniref:Uncharacterized protein n=1 Tax=Epicoccum nigrum TaxID=105696 RepID=A0A1Y2MAF4_EPING|nr:hypothetical protein B5807_02184 [Epicoccum nigrum]